MLSLGSIRTGPSAFGCESLKASVEPSCLSKDSAESPHTSPALHFCFLQALKLLRVSIYDRQEAPFYASSSAALFAGAFDSWRCHLSWNTSTCC